MTRTIVFLKSTLKDSLPYLPLGFLILAFLLFILRRLVFAIATPLRSIPGPFAARFTRLWYLKHVYKGHFEQVNIDLHKKYGPIVRIAPNEYSIIGADAIRTIYTHGTKFTKAPWYIASGNPDPESHDLFTDRDSKRHAAARRKVASLYSMTSLVQMESCVTRCMDVFFERLREAEASDTIFNLQFWLQCFAMDAIGLITLKKRFGFLDDCGDKFDLIKALNEYLVYAANVGVYNEWHRWLSMLSSGVSDTGFGFMMRFVQGQISEASKGFTEKGDFSIDEAGDTFLEKLLKMNTKNPDNISSKDVFTACITNIGAGSDTTSISITAILYFLMKEPSTLHKLRAEIRQAEANGAISSPYITFRESQNLPYLQAVIKEALRVHPATGLPLARVVPEGGATICGQHFPAGTFVGVNTWVAHQSAELFGEDADQFRPERWLEDRDQSRKQENYFLAFGAGSRTCIGKNISLMEIGILVPELIRRFDLSLIRPNEPLETRNTWFVKQKNIICRVRQAPS